MPVPWVFAHTTLFVTGWVGPMLALAPQPPQAISAIDSDCSTRCRCPAPPRARHAVARRRPKADRPGSVETYPRASKHAWAAVKLSNAGVESM